MQNKMIRAGLCAALLCLLLAGCGRGDVAALSPGETQTPAPQELVFAAGAIPLDTGELKMPLAAGETELLSSLTQLRSADLSGSADEAEVAAWAKAHPDIECYYSVTLPGGEVLDSGTRSYDVSALSAEQAEAVAEKLALLPDLKTLRLGAEGSRSWESVARLRALLPDTVLRYGFTLYGKSCDLSDASLNLRAVPVEDDCAALRRVIPLMKDLSYVDMDSTGVSNQDMEKLRAEFPDVKFVWRVWFGENYSVRTDVQRILASKPSAGGMLYNWDVEALSCCRDVVFLDLGHNKQLTDISFVRNMPKLEVAILGMCDWSDASPLADCPELEYLEMFSTECTDLTPLKGLKNLKHLNVAGIPGLEDISPLYSLTQLERLWLGSMNRLTEDQYAEFKKHVPDCELDTLVYDDPTGGHWRWDENGDMVPRYYLLRLQFGKYDSEVYSYTWNDKLYTN